MSSKLRFQVLHSEKLPSAINRYVEEAKRICGVLEQGLMDKNYCGRQDDDCRLCFFTLKRPTGCGFDVRGGIKIRRFPAS
jgi:hypothetical protein